MILELNCVNKLLHSLLNSFAGSSLNQHGLKLEKEINVLLHCQSIKQDIVLRTSAHHCLCLLNVLTNAETSPRAGMENNITFRWLFLAHENIQRSCLAGSIVPQKAENLILEEIQIH